MPTEVECAYLAGFLDGEGYVSLIAQPANGGSSRDHHVTVGLSNTHLPTLERLHVIWGGKIRAVRPSNQKWKTVYQLMWQYLSAVSVLRLIQPYLVTKVEQCRIALELAERKHSGVGRRMVTLAEWEAREDLRLAMKALNIQRTEGLARLPYPKSTGSCQNCGTTMVLHFRRTRFCSAKCRMRTWYIQHPGYIPPSQRKLQ